MKRVLFLSCFICLLFNSCVKHTYVLTYEIDGDTIVQEFVCRERTSYIGQDAYLVVTPFIGDSEIYVDGSVFVPTQKLYVKDVDAYERVVESDKQIHVVDFRNKKQ